MHIERLTSSRLGRGLARAAAAAIVTGSAISLVAPVSASASVAPKIKAGGTATYLVPGIFSQVDPAFEAMINFAGPQMEAVYGPGLVYQDPATGQNVMGFAKSLTASRGNRIWTMVLRPHLKFSDGTAFNAQAVVDSSMVRYANPATGSFLQAIASSISAHALNATTVRFTLSAPNSQFPALVATDFAAVPSPTAVASEGSAFTANPVGPGPFKVQSYVSGLSYTFTRNPYYKAYAPGQPYLNGITIENQADNSQQIADYQTNQAQMGEATTGQLIQQARGVKMTVAYHVTVGGGWLAFGEKQPPFNNILARKAVYDALSRDGISSVWAPDTPVQSNYFPKTSPYYNPKLNWPAGNPTEAQSLFNQLAAAGTPVNFSVLWPTGTNAVTANYIQSALSSFHNVKATPNVTTSAVYYAAAHAGNFQLTAQGDYYPSIFPSLAQTFQTGGALNYPGVSDPVMDKYLTAMSTQSNPAAVKADVSGFLKELISQYDIIPTQSSVVGLIYNAKEIGGIKATDLGISPLWGQVYHK